MDNMHLDTRAERMDLLRALPAPLLDYCTVCFEEQLFAEAFSILSSVITDGVGSKGSNFIPLPQHLSLAVTLAVHPRFTTRTFADDKHAAADDALRYLQKVVKLVDPRSGRFAQVFAFPGRSEPSRGKRARGRWSETPVDSDGHVPGRIRSSYLDKDALWSNADDFWSVVGWAFNCSVTHKHRWARWELWLVLMLNLLESDLACRMQKKEGSFQQDTSASAASESLLATYLLPTSQGRSNKRRVMRAILADASQKSLAEFGEIWKNETKLPKKIKDQPPAKRKKLDLENGEFADYFDYNSQDDAPTASSRGSRSTTAAPSVKPSRAASETLTDGEPTDESELKTEPPKSGVCSPIETWGGISSIHLRLRLLALVVRFCAADSASSELEDLFDLATEFLRPLPLGIFQHFVRPSKPYLDSDALCSLDQMLLRPLLSGSAPPYNENAFTQTRLGKHYAPFAANTANAIDNAKVSLLVESLLRLLWKNGSLRNSADLEESIKTGIEARNSKVAIDGRRKVGNKAEEEKEAMMVMKWSAQRMLVILQLTSDA